MRKTTLTLTILFAVSALMYAGPEAFSGKEMKQVAPAPAPACFNWSGFYVGGFGGYKFSNVDLNLDLSGGWNNIPGSRDLFESEGSRDLDNSGGEAGGLIGYNFQWNCWVLGLEADGGYLWARDSRDSGTLVPPDDIGLVHIRNAFQTHYLFTVAPRIGYALGRWLPYVTGGLAVGDLELEQRIDFIGDGPGSGEGGRKTQTNVGWMVGGGLQYALTDHWSLRAQYQYIDLGDINFDSNFSFIDSPSHHHAELTEHNASFAIMYKF
ncbi:MAG TPA: outer membrane beta-barrel protein [Chthoniobacterales bacterium]|nr:outer membrane beta-barrel protein [Chthoniobacterales bacterium]